MPENRYFLFDNIPGVHPSWTLAVCATSERDAQKYIKLNHGHGKLVGMVESGTVNASCGAITENARMNHA